MGRSYMPAYRMEVKSNAGVFFTPSGWTVNSRTNAPGCGRPTAANLEKAVLALGRSMNPGGVNAHLAKVSGEIPYPTSAKLIRQRDGKVMATWTVPKFMVW